MSAIAWDTVENAIHAALVAASGLAATAVVWEYQKGHVAARPYISIKLDELDKAGQDWRVVDDAPDAVAGAELRIRRRGLRTARVELQCFAPEGSAMTALRVLTDTISALVVQEYALDLAGVGVGDTTAVQLVEGRRGGILEPRALAAIGIHLASEVESRETYVERMNITLTEVDAGEVADFWIPDPPP